MTAPALAPAQLLADAARILPELVTLRRDLHRHPEVGLHLPRTQQAVLRALDGLSGLEIVCGTATTSVVAVLRGGRPGPTVLLRGDMDALPVTELADVEYRSTNDAMHACGHDLHTAGLVGAARLLHAARDTLAGTVVFMFQPGEEGHDGAQVMLDEGVLAAAGTPSAAFAVHVGPGDRGTFVTRPGPILAGAAELRILVRGSGGHGSQPHSTHDPIPAAAALVGALQSMVTRRFPAFDPVVLSITRVRAGDALNVIPDTAELAGTVRMVSPDAATRLPERIRETADGVASAHGCTAEVDFDLGYPVTVNDPAETAAAVGDLTRLVGAESIVSMPHPAMGSEDFSRILERVPGTYLFLGARPDDVPEEARGEVNHSPRIVFDDAVLGTHSAALAWLAVRALERHG
ncbi:M20 metallopeptidase family protein [Tomitella gaofuii]|uniref:M20 metallopeptidase family protein n=1 Tax=Tomitella gaofuii TaxID=2760083 RepID=UPI0020BE16F8|nr:M20 family metallopeptidase [Tomitella gaofuii]